MTIHGYLTQKKSLTEKTNSTLRLLQIDFQMSKTDRQRKVE